MAVAAQAVNLATYALMSNNPLVQAITSSLIDYGNVVVDIPMFTKATLIGNGVRWEGNLPTVTWRPLNSEGQTTQGTPTAYQEQAYIMTQYVDVDKYIVLDQNSIGNVRANQTNAVLKAITYDFNYKFFKNDHLTGDQNAPVGIKYRIANGGTYGVRPENSIDANGLDLSHSGIASTPSNANVLLELLDQLLWSVDSPDGAGVILYVNDVFKRRINYTLRSLGTSGGLSVMQDQFDRTITMYKQAKIVDPGYKADQVTRIIAGNGLSGSSATGETSAGADSTGSSAVYTSAYAVNYSDDHFFGWEFDNINVQDLGLINNGVIYRTLIDWAIGFMNASTRSLGRLYDLKIA